MLEVYRAFAEDVLAMPVIAGEKPENERFPGAVNTYSIEAMMQDGKALQAGTSHFLGTHFAEAQNIRFQNEAGDLDFCNTTSWGVSTRLIGGVIMTHGDDDGLRLPPAIAPRQIVVVPMLRDKPEDAEVLAYCEDLAKALNARPGLRPAGARAAGSRSPVAPDKRWNWVQRGAPMICEIGPRDAAAGNVTYMRRDELRDGEKIQSQALPRQQFVEQISALLGSIHSALHAAAQQRAGRQYPHRHHQLRGAGRVLAHGPGRRGGQLIPRLGESRLGAAGGCGTGQGRAAVEEPEAHRAQCAAWPRTPITDQRCVFSGEPAREFVLVGRSY